MACQLVASEWCGNSILGGLSIKGTLPWWNTGIMMCNEMGWISKHMRSSCHRVKVVLPCVELLVYWKAIEGMATLNSRINPWILSVQSLEAHHHTPGFSDQCLQAVMSSQGPYLSKMLLIAGHRLSAKSHHSTTVSDLCFWSCFVCLPCLCKVTECNI